MPGVTPHGMDYHHNYGGMNGHDRGYGYGPSTYNSAPPLSTYRESEFGLSVRNGYGGPEIDQHSMDRFDNTRDMEPTFELDHLATYSSKSGVMKPEDGLRKLRGMESTTGIWTMRCVMIIERKNLIVIDKGNGEELERFPLELVHEPTAIFKEDKREVYTNLIMFTMLENPGKYSSRCDMHIFQSINAPAQDIVDELLAAKEGRPKLFQSSIPPPPMGPAPDPPGGRWLGGNKEPKSHFSYSTDAQEPEHPIVGKREKHIKLPAEKHVISERIVPGGKHQPIQIIRTPVEEHYTKEKYIPLGLETREKMPTPPTNRRFARELFVPEERRQRNALLSVPSVNESRSMGHEHYVPLEEMQQKIKIPPVQEHFTRERYIPLGENHSRRASPHVKEHFVERRYVPSGTERRSSLGDQSYGSTSGFSTSAIEEEEFDVPEKYLSLTSRRGSGSSNRNRSSSVDRYTLPNSHSSSVMSDGYAVPYDPRNSDKHNFASRERRSSTGGLEIPPAFTMPRSRLSTSSANTYEIPLQVERSMPYRSGSAHDILSAVRREGDYFPDSSISSGSGRGKWKFGDRRQQFSSSNQGSSSGYSSMEPSVHYGTMPNTGAKSKQSSRYQFKTTTLRDEGQKSNASSNGLRNEGFRVIPSSEGFRPPSEGFRTEPFRSQNEGPRGDMYSLPMRDKDSVNSDRRGGNYGQSQYRASYTEPPGGQNESLERDVQILNSCFDDIEKFVARLQQAAEAYKELENRKRERQSHKKKNDRAPPPRDGMLNMRARPPPGDDFIDIFQKIKCAFNLLSKLKAHIHDPNAPELVHFIFTPLSLIYEASRDPVHVGIDLASKAVAPLLTREAKELLLNCLTSKELELWQLLGRNWTTSEDEMQSTQRNLFKPTIDKSQLEQSLANHKHQIEENTRAEEARFQSQQMIRQLPTPREEPRDDYRATKVDDFRATRGDNYGSTNYGRTQPEEPSYSRTRREEEPSYHTGPIGASSRIGQSFRPEEDDHYRREPMYDRKHPSTPPPGAVTNPNVAKYQEYVEKHIDRNQDVNRYSGGNKSRGQENQEYKEELRRKNAKIYEAVHERTGRNQKEITVEKGDILEVLDDSRNWWRLRNYKGDSGYAPYTILRDAGDDRNDIDRNVRDTLMDMTYLNGGGRGSIGGYSGNINQSNHIPVAPPPPRKDEEEFVREIKPSRHQRNDSDGRSDGSDCNRKGRRQDKRSSSSDPYGSRDDTPDSSDADNFSGSYDGSIEDRVEGRRSNNRRNERETGFKPALKNRNSGELKRAGESRGYQNRSFEEESNRHRTRTPPPPPSFVPPPPPENRPPSASKKYNPPGQANKRQQDQLHNELSQRLAGKPSVKSKPQNPNVYLSTKSSAKEVVEWLYSKSFSQKCIDVLRGYNGHDLLRMKMKDLERLINHDEAQRLDGHLTLQKNMSGYKTQGPKELQAILQQRKQKADTHDDDVGRPPSFAPESPDYSDDNSEVQGITDDLDTMLSNY
ncbi:uncharacterized protein LOC134685545 isoform X3 [Mytilus trossulus]|uniref:uncharacterized protein LOC134685545 isoform X3 n=1 Tax=Mytilus trossulus TaxID=6551 RepID=UPI00300690D8